MARFLIFTFALSWTCFVAGLRLAAAGSTDPGLAALQTGLLLLGTFAPALVSLAITAWDEGMTGAEALVGRVFDAPSGARWYVFAIGYYLAVKLSAAALTRLIGGVWPPFGVEPWYVIVGAMVVSTPVQGGEEIGWRGYLLPRLAARMGLAPASLVLGLIWAVWHLPLFFVHGIHNYGQSFPMFAFGVVALSVAMTWLYAHTNGSLLIMMLMHSAVNQETDIVRTTNPGSTNPLTLDVSLMVWVFMALLGLCAVYFFIRMPPAPEPRYIRRNTSVQ